MRIVPTANEIERLEALRKLSILYSQQLPEFDAIVQNIALIFDCPIALISLVDKEEQWFKARHGLDMTGSARDQSFCQFTILSDDIMVIPDAADDERFQASLLVTGEPHIRFYAGAPLCIDGEHRLGTLCVIDQKPRQPTELQLTQLRNLATVVESLIKAHKSELDAKEALLIAEREHERAVRDGDLLQEITSVSGVGGWEVDLKTDTLTWTAKTREIHQVDADFQPTVETALSFYPPDSRKQVAAALEKSIQQETGWDLELPFVTAKGKEIWVRAVGRPVSEDGTVCRVIGAFQDITERKCEEQKVRHDETVQRTTLEALREGILLLSRTGQIQSFNPAVAGLLGCKETELSGANVEDLNVSLQSITDENKEHVNPLVFAARAPDSVINRETRVYGTNPEQTKWLRISAKPIDSNLEHGLDGVVVSLTDITTVKQQADTLQVIFDNFPGGLVHYDSQLRLASWNKEFAHLLKLPETFLAQKPSLQQVLEFIAARGDYGPGNPEQIALERMKIFNADSRHSYERETQNGMVLEVHGTPLPGGGTVSSFQDITLRKRMEQQLVENERLARHRFYELEAVLANMRQGVSVFDRDGGITLWNQQYVDLFGKPEGEIRKGMKLIELLELEKSRGEFGGSPNEFATQLTKKLKAGEVVKTTLKHPNGKIISIIRTPLPDGGWVGTHEDVTLREKATEKITYAAHHDTLTGLANRTLFNLKLDEAINRSEILGEISDLLLIDLDCFKPVNDTYGHDAGDDLLIKVAKRFKECVRASDTVARLGGDEFAIIIGNTDGSREFVTEIARRIVDQLQLPFQIKDETVRISASVGIAPVCDADGEASPIIKKADMALYAVKHSGRNGYRHFEDLNPFQSP